MRDYNEFGHGQKRYRSDDGGKKRRSQQTIGQNKSFKPQILILPSGLVSETDEEDSVSSGE